MEVSWAMCANPMCDNFGVLYGAEDEAGGDASRYRVTGGNPPTLVCRRCGYSPTLHAPLSVRPLARHFLAQSLPFADCPNEACVHHGINAFEYLGQRVGTYRSPYRQVGSHRLACRECERRERPGAGFQIGTSLGLSRGSRSVRENVAKQLTRVWEGDSVARSLFGTARKDGRRKRLVRQVGTHCRPLFAVAARMRDYAAWRNAFLLSPEFRAMQTEPVEVHDDVLELSLHRTGDRSAGEPSHKLLRVIVSVVNLRRHLTHFILAAHLYFLPADACPDLAALEEDKERTPLLGRRWEGLETALNDRKLVIDGQVAPDLPARGYDGYLMRSPYAEVAHFLTVDRMLSACPRRHYYMDGERAQARAALVAMRRQIRAKQVEIVLFQYAKEGEQPNGKEAESGAGGRTRRDAARLRRSFRKTERRFRAQVKAGSGALDEDTERTRAARVWRTAFVGANSQEGGWAWLRYPPGNGQCADCRTLWLTRRPGDGLDEGAGLLLNATLQAVDANFGYVRHHLRPAQRRQTSARQRRRSYVRHSYDPRVVCAELSMYLLLRNYYRRPAAEERHVRAEAMGLVPRHRPVPAPDKVVWSFRLGVAHAREITRWLRNR